jgi:hypothetical protein
MMLLELNHILFAWYYKRVPVHFRQWTLFKSIHLLIQNYNHQQLLLESERRCTQFASEEAENLRKQLQAYQWKELGVDPATTMRLNTMFGTDMPAGNEN